MNDFCPDAKKQKEFQMRRSTKTTEKKTISGVLKSRLNFRPISGEHFWGEHVLSKNKGAIVRGLTDGEQCR